MASPTLPKKRWGFSFDFIETGFKRFTALFTFSKNRRVFLYHSILEGVMSNEPVAEIFESIQTHQDSVALKEIAKKSRSSIRAKKPFAQGWSDTSYFTKTEENLLIMGEKYSCVPEICRLLNSINEGGKSFLGKVLADNNTWILLILSALVMTIYGEDTARFAGEDDPYMFLALRSLLQTWGIAILLSIISVIAGYLWFRRRATGAQRKTFQRFLLFPLYDDYLEQKLIKVFAALCYANAPAGELYDALISAFEDEPSLVYRLKKGKALLRQGRLRNTLPAVLSPVAFSFVDSKAKHGETSKQFVEGFGLAFRMKELTINLKAAIFHLMADFFFMVLAALLLMPVVMTMMVGSM